MSEHTEIQIEEVQKVTYRVDGKLYNSIEEAREAKDKLRHLETGLQFAEAQYPGLADRAKRTKANMIAEYLAWEEAGRPVATLEDEDSAE